MDFTGLQRFVDPTGRSSDPRLINAVAAYCGASLAGPEDLVHARRLAAERIGDAIVSTDTLAAVQNITGSSVFVVRENGVVTGMTAFFLLRPSGMDAIANGAFDSINIDYDHVCRPREAPAGGYAWGFVGSTERGSGRAVKASLAVRETLLWALPGYTRAATPDGARLIFGSLGFVPVAGDPTLARYEGRSEPLIGIWRDQAA